MGSIVTLLRDGFMDVELASLVWLLAEGGVPVHVAGDAAERVADAVRPLARDPAAVSAGAGAALEDVLRQPVPLRPASGAVLIVREGRVAAAHLQRAPLRDAAGHVRPRGPAVLATWDAAAGEWEHFAWGIIPEMAFGVGRKAGDFEIDQGRRRELLEALLAGGVERDEDVERAMRAHAIAPRRPA